jgi:hypothetical protein
MPRKKKPQKEKAPESTTEFVARLAKQDAKVNGKKIRLGFAHHHR